MKSNFAQQQLLELLQKSAPKALSGQYIAAALSVTTRTVRNYVRELNDAGYEIDSSKSGYRYVRGDVQVPSFLGDDDLTALRVLLYEQRNGISVFALTDQLHVSEATLIRQMKKLDEWISTYQVHVQIHDNVIILTGSEHAKRHLIYLLVSHESQQDILKTNMLPEGQELDLKQILRQEIAKHHLHVNTGTFNNILVHLSVAMYRINNAYQLDSGHDHVLVESLKKSGALQVAEDVSEAINKRLNITMAQPEVINLAMLFQDTLRAQEPDAKQLRDLVEQRFNLLATVLLTTVDRNYSMNLVSDSVFVSRFALHLQNLYGRLQVKKQPVPPINKAIKKQFPFIYEIAVSTVGQLSEILETRIPEAEIDFIAMHIGTRLMNTAQEDKLKLVLVDHNYLNSNQNISTRLESNFGGRVEIASVYQNYRDLPVDVDYQHVVSTAEPLPDERILKISPFLDSDDLERIKNRIGLIESQNQSKHLENYLERFLPPELLYFNQDFNGAGDCISWLSDKMIVAGFADQEFKKSVLLRESLSSTAFVPDVAIPHPLKPITEKTTLAILVNQKPMSWNGSFVRVVVLLGLSPNDHNAFQGIFESLIDSLSDQKVVGKLSEATGYQEVIKILKSGVSH